MANDPGCGGVILGLAILWGVSQCHPTTSSVDAYIPSPAISEPQTSQYNPALAAYQEEFEDEATVALGDLGEYDGAEGEALSNADYYDSSDGEIVHAPAYSLYGGVPAGASAQCEDGTYSFSRHRSGTCSHHGGVESWQ